jgi:hypothetical protein
MAQEEVLHQSPGGFLLAEEVVARSRDLLSQAPGPGRLPGHDCGQGRTAGGQQSGRRAAHAVEHRISHARWAIEKAVGKHVALPKKADVLARAIVAQAG